MNPHNHQRLHLFFHGEQISTRQPQTPATLVGVPRKQTKHRRPHHRRPISRFHHAHEARASPRRVRLRAPSLLRVAAEPSRNHGYVGRRAPLAAPRDAPIPTPTPSLTRLPAPKKKEQQKMSLGDFLTDSGPSLPRHEATLRPASASSPSPLTRPAICRARRRPLVVERAPLTLCRIWRRLLGRRG